MTRLVAVVACLGAFLLLAVPVQGSSGSGGISPDDQFQPGFGSGDLMKTSTKDSESIGIGGCHATRTTEDCATIEYDAADSSGVFTASMADSQGVDRFRARLRLEKLGSDGWFKIAGARDRSQATSDTSQKAHVYLPILYLSKGMKHRLIATVNGHAVAMIIIR